MSKKTHSRKEVGLAIAKVLRERVAQYEADLEALRSRELKKSQNGASFGLCPLCGGADVGGSCGCVVELKKNAGCMPGTQPMSMAEPVAAPQSLLTKLRSKKIAKTELRKDMATQSASAASSARRSAFPKMPKVVGVAGKQMVGAGGGDAGKTQSAPTSPHTTAALADVKGLSPSGQWKAQGLPGLKAKLATVKAPVAGAAAPTLPTAAPAAAAPAAKPAIPGGSVLDDPTVKDRMHASLRSAADLKADKRAAGVGWLNSLLSRFHKIAPRPVGTGPVRSAASPYAGVRGMAALARSETFTLDTFKKSMASCLLCGGPEHFSACLVKSEPLIKAGTDDYKLAGIDGYTVRAIRARAAAKGRNAGHLDRQSGIGVTATPSGKLGVSLPKPGLAKDEPAMNTKHSSGCNTAFGRRTPGCGRCDELKGGAAPRKGWGGGGKFNGKPSANAAPHSCKDSKCGPVCTFGDW